MNLKQKKKHSRITAFLLAFIMVFSMAAMIPPLAVSASEVNLIDTLPPYVRSSTSYVVAHPTSGETSITLGGTAYKNAIGFTSWSGTHTANFNLGGSYTTFTGIVGRMGNSTGIGRLNVYGDDILILAMDIPVGLPSQFQVNVTGVRDMKIEVKQANNNITTGLAQLQIGTDATTIVNTSYAKNLVDIYEPYHRSSTSYAVPYPTNGTDTITLGGAEQRNSIGFTSWSGTHSISYNLNSRHTSLTGVVGRMGTNATADGTLNIYNGTAVLHTMSVAAGLPQSFSINLTGVSDLKIEVVQAQNNITIGLAQLVLDGGAAVTPPPAPPTPTPPTPPPTPEPPVTPDPPAAGKVTFNGNQYQVFDTSMTWTEAKAYAESLGGHLVTITSQAEQDFVQSLIKDGTKNQYWIGADCEESRGNWKWVTGEPWSYTNWASGEPRLHTGTYFVHMYRLVNPLYPSANDVGKWNDANNNNVFGSEAFFAADAVGFVVEWSSAATPVPPIAQLPFTAEATENGVKLDWQPITGAIGYRVYRSTVMGTQGIDVTDFPIATTTHLDFNVLESTNYYYSLHPLYAEATITTSEQLGDAINAYPYPVLTRDVLIKIDIPDGMSTQNYIIMQLNNPMMTVNGEPREVDPGRGTTPMLINARTMVPIRAIVEAMNGKVTWGGEEPEDSDAARMDRSKLEANGNTVVMWVGSTTITVNGLNKIIDVAPEIRNNRTMVPIRFALQDLGCAVTWIGSTSEVVITYFTAGAPILPAPSPGPGPAPVPAPAPAPGVPEPPQQPVAPVEPTPPAGNHTGNATAHRGKNNELFSYNIVGASSGSVWGTDIYTDDSIIARAAVHAGLVTVGQSAVVTIRILPGQSSYIGSTRNGVTSNNYASWSGSYEFVTSGAAPTPTPTPVPDPVTPTPDPVAPAPPATGFAISVAKTVYTAGETITVNVTGATFEHRGTTRVVLAYAGSLANASRSTQYINAAGTSTLTFSAPSEDTFYELRLFSDTSTAETSIIQRIPISVVNTAGLTAPPEKFEMMPLAKTTYMAGETITVPIQGAKFDQKGTTRVVLAYAGSLANASRSTQYINAAGTSSLTFSVPSEDTFYELRLFSDTSTAETSIIQRIPINVVKTAGLTAPPEKLEMMPLAKTAYVTGETITVTIQGAKFDQKGTTRVVLAYAGSAANASRSTQYINAAGTSTLTFNVPSEDTNYELRLFSDTTTAETSIIQRIPFTVVLP